VAPYYRWWKGVSVRSRAILGVVVPAALFVALFAATANPAGSTGGTPVSTVPTSGSTTTTPTTTSTTTTSTTTTSTTPPARAEDNPFTAPIAASYLEHRTDVVTAAVYDVTSGATFTYHNGIRERTASMVKIDILADLLYESQRTHVALTPRQVVLATQMIELSDNGATNRLWSEIGRFDAINEFNELIGFKATIPSYSWGDIDTTPLDQLQLLKVIVLPNSILDPASRAFEMGLMEHTIASERFGLGWGSPATALVGVKDGYYLESTTGWQLNTTGFVKYQGRFYLATIMSEHNPNEDYGISTVTQVAQFIWKYLKP
jgi:hypothetical protein